VGTVPFPDSPDKLATGAGTGNEAGIQDADKFHWTGSEKTEELVIAIPSLTQYLPAAAFPVRIVGVCAFKKASPNARSLGQCRRKWLVEFLPSRKSPAEI